MMILIKCPKCKTEMLDDGIRTRPYIAGIASVMNQKYVCPKCGYKEG